MLSILLGSKQKCILQIKVIREDTQVNARDQRVPPMEKVTLPQIHQSYCSAESSLEWLHQNRTD